MKIGDLVKFESALSDDMDRYVATHGLVIQMSRTGHETESAQVLFNDGETWWLDTQKLVVVNEAG
jgi:hypothetical protein